MIGTRLGSWILEDEIGRGGMGTVYRARRAPDHEVGPPTAAIKILAAELAVEVGFQQRFQREIAILQQLAHPVIVAFYGSGVQEELRVYWYAMELIDGESYEQIRERTARLAWPEVLDLAWQLAPALKHAHDRGVVHRDIKPSNLLRVRDESDPEGPGLVKLTDFGIASLFSSPHLTVTGGVIGTPEYLSPEQAAGKPVTKRSDLYSLGVVLYTLITGSTPFVGEPIDLLHKHRFGQFDRPGRFVPEIAPDFEDLICNLLEKDPANRPGDAGVLFRRLDGIRRKAIRQAAERLANTEGGATRSASAGTGPATFVSNFVRAELEAQNRGGPVKRFFNHPLVVIVLFLFCSGTIVWTLWPASAESLFQKGSRLMASPDPADWERAWERYFEPMETRFPDHGHREELEAFRQKLADQRADPANDANPDDRRLSEGQWFFEKAMRLRRRGDAEAARKTLQGLIDAYQDLPSQRLWVFRARKELEKKTAPAPKGLKTLREALDRARKLEKEGEPDQAAAIRRGLRELYGEDKPAMEVLKKE